MDGNERITTLILHGCVCQRRPVSVKNDPDWRCITLWPPHLQQPSLTWRVRALPHKGMRWFNTWGSHAANIEVPFDAVLIAFIPEKMFVQFLVNLTR